MIAHAGLPVSSYEDAKRFYTAVLATLGYTLHLEYDGAGGFNDGNDTQNPSRIESPTRAVYFIRVKTRIK